MNILFLENIIVTSFIINLLITFFIIYRSRSRHNFKRTIFGALLGFAVTIGIVFIGLTVSLFLTLFITYPVEIAITFIVSIALITIPIGSFMGFKGI